MSGTGRMTANLFDALTAYTEAALAALSWVPERVVHLAPGAAVAWDECCGGQLWARLISMEPAPSQTPTRPGSAVGGCNVSHFIATVELGLLRCASTVTDAGEAPPAETITAEGVACLEDSFALLQAIMCQPTTRTLGRYTPQGPQGGCVGGVWTFTVRVDNCVRCADD